MSLNAGAITGILVAVIFIVIILCYTIGKLYICIGDHKEEEIEQRIIREMELKTFHRSDYPNLTENQVNDLRAKVFLKRQGLRI